MLYLHLPRSSVCMAGKAMQEWFLACPLHVLGAQAHVCCIPFSPWLQVDEHSARDVVLIICLVEEHILTVPALQGVKVPQL